MPVHEIKYHAWEGELQPLWRRIFAIPKYSLMAVLNKWVLMTMFGMGMIQFLAYTGYLSLITNPVLMKMVDVKSLQLIPTADIFRRFYLVQFMICLVILIQTAPRMISPELAHRSLAIIYSRAITQSHYILGKTLGLFIILSCLTWIQTLGLFILMMAMHQDADPFWQDFWAVSLPAGLKSIFVGVVMSTVLSLFALACGSFTKNARHALVLMLIILFGSSFFTNIVQEFISAKLPDFGLRELFYSLCILCFDNHPPEHLSFVITLAILLGWAVVSWFVMVWRLKPVEIYDE
jgi:hypothetical protein